VPLDHPAPHRAEQLEHLPADQVCEWPAHALGGFEHHEAVRVADVLGDEDHARPGAEGRADVLQAVHVHAEHALLAADAEHQPGGADDAHPEAAQPRLPPPRRRAIR
jgi:hypothetical protein